ncbi:hypothetical protein DFJ74DRAFT_211289 [Hyaloraphidium curvatum]|nr:hypothetical protein DFJ74DRAFT_211289 [Hyaloraphidium curvatum]
MVDFFIRCDMGLPLSSRNTSYEDKRSVSLHKLAEEVTLDRNVRCWIRTLDGTKRNEPWVVAADDDMLGYLLEVWSSDSLSYEVLFRPKGRSSPNTTPPESPAELAHSFANLDVRDCDNTVDPFRLEDVDALGDEAVELTDGTVRLRVHGERLFDFVKSEIANGKALDHIQVANLVLTTCVWTSSLLRQKKYADRFVSLFVDMCSRFRTVEGAHHALQNNTDLFNRLKFFLVDLMSYAADDEAQQRLESDLAAPFYMSSTYFTAEEAEFILTFPTPTGLSFQQNLEVLIGNKMGHAATASARDYALCTAHDIAPLIRDVFKITKGFQESKAFQAARKAFNKATKKAAKMKSRGQQVLQYELRRV